MSTDWGIGCRTCFAKHPDDRAAYFSGEYDNCRSPDGLQRLINARDVIVLAAATLGRHVRFFWSDWSEDVADSVAEFFVEHTGHDLSPMDEYGGFNDDCYHNVQCGECKTTHKCRRKRGHDGEHSYKAPK